MEPQELKTYADQYGIRMTNEQAALMLWDMDKVLEINEIHNLTAIVEETAFIDKHLIDSCLCDLSSLPPKSKVLDLGTGGGFPGIPLAILYPHLEFTLLDATEKKIRIVASIAEELGLKNVGVLSGRAEALAKETGYREQFDAVVSRGVAAYGILAELCLPFVRPHGCFYSWKGPKYQTECEEAARALEVLKGRIVKVQATHLANVSEDHMMIICKKTAPTPECYPRNYGTIKKKPL